MAAIGPDAVPEAPTADALHRRRLQAILSQCTQRVYTERVHTSEAGVKQIPKSGQAGAILGLVDKCSW